MDDIDLMRTQEEFAEEIKQLRHELRVKDAEIEDVRGNNFNLQDEIRRLRAENADLRKWLDGCRLIISNMQPKEVPND